MEWISHFWDAIGPIHYVERWIVVLEVVWEWLRVRRRLWSLGVSWIKDEKVFPFDLDAIPVKY